MIAHRDIVYNIRAIVETVQTGAGDSNYTEEGLVDIADGRYSFRTIPALVAQTPAHLPSSTHLLLGVPQINELDIKCDVHRKQRRLPLQSVRTVMLHYHRNHVLRLGAYQSQSR